MSNVSEQQPLDSPGPLSFAPRWLRERQDARSAQWPETSSEPVQTFERRGGRTAELDGFDTQLENAVSEALYRPLDPEVIHEPAELTRELRRMAAVGVAARFAAAIGVSAVVAAFFVVMIPASRQPEGIGSSASGLIQSFRTALSQLGPKDAEATLTPSEFQNILDSTPVNQPVTREQSEKLLQQFVQWRQKPAPSQAP